MGHPVAAHHRKDVDPLRDGTEGAVPRSRIRLVGEVEDLVAGGTHPVRHLEPEAHATVLA